MKGRRFGCPTYEAKHRRAMRALPATFSVAFIMLLLVEACSETASLRPTASLYEAENPYDMDVFDGFTVNDPSRSRMFPIRVRYPRAAISPLPLIVFSHGGGYNNTGHLTYEDWGSSLAKAGYMVIHIAHVDDAPNSHCQPLGIPPGECEPADFGVEVVGGGTLGSVWYNRCRDATAVLNALDAIEAAVGRKVDRSKMGLAGHSGGAHTVIDCAGAKVDYSRSVRQVTYSEPRFKAFLANSPQGSGRLGYTAASWSTISVPVMVTTGASDMTASETAAERLEPYQNMPPPDKYQLYINSMDASHSVFGLNALSPGLQGLEEYVFSAGLAFLDAYVQGKASARSWLISNQIDAVSNNVATIVNK